MEKGALQPAGDLLARVSTGDEGVYERLFLGEADRLWKMAYLLLQGAESADDVLRESCARGWKEWASAQSSVRAWLAGLTLDLCRRALRDACEGCDLGDMETLERWRRMGNPRIVVGLPVRRDRDPRLALALGYLSWSQREAVVLRFVVELSYEEMAPLLGVPPGAARTLTQRARALLKDKLGRVNSPP